VDIQTIRLIDSINEDLDIYQLEISGDETFKGIARRLLMSLIGVSNPDNCRFRLFANKRLRSYMTPIGVN